ncbi:hypothetical protein E0Z10_g9830 [Xylaria hypoxylon]|uniref:Uncharacterized protein n=1 Tax=Xylaria hypoxylon TaxID=37992 RepID=A0A4Z0YJ31_9PEZI|nr:hypothetical protein E0Z10_g9830 [Xylaria hypoxylon]
MGGFPQGHSAVPPAPPRNMIPVDLRGGPAVQISDISRDLFSESDMKEEITDYMVFRFEKMADKDEFDDHGRPKWPSWEKAIRTEDRSISKQMAAKKVRQLNRTTRDAPDKKNSLPSALKRQIDSTLEFLTSREPDLINFHWVLAQIDHQLRTIQPYYSNLSYHSIPARKHRSPTAYRFPSKKRSYSGSGNRHTKKAYERISLTAYFQRVPRQGVDVARLWKEKRRGLDGMYHPHPGGVHNVVPQMQPNHTQFQGQQNANRGQGPPPTQMPNRNPQGPQVPPQNRPMNHDAHQQHNGGQGHRQNGKKGGRHSDSETDSGNESHSSRSSSSTGPSSVSDHRGGGHHNNRHHVGNPANHIHNHLPRHERPAGVHKANGSPQLARTSLSPRRSPRAPAPPYPLSRDDGSVASNIERIREEAYRRGRLAERTDARLAEELAFSKTHARPRPHIIQEHSPPPVRVYRARTDEDDIPRYFNRLSLLDDEEDDVEFHREEARRLREYERRVQHGSILEEDPFEGSPSPSSYTYSTDGRGRGRRRMPQIVEIPHLLNPRPRRRMLYD